ncbi:hypothetical protein PZ07_02830 [Lacticaseibacillus rhamnosus]|nr:hypothetical protein PZ07_02830 [Lacticaseibacillus rhamnosus]
MLFHFVHLVKVFLVVELGTDEGGAPVRMVRLGVAGCLWIGAFRLRERTRGNGGGSILGTWLVGDYFL